MSQVDIIKRLETFISSEGLSLNNFARGAGIDPGNMAKMLANKQKITDKTLQKISTSYGINFQWLKHGEDSMFVDDCTPARATSEQTRPRIPVTAAAGYLSGIAEGVSASDCELVPVIPGVPDYACTIVVHGDSMMPKYESGDELAITPVRDRASLLWGHTYVLDTRDGTILKRLYDHNPDTVRCVSYNPEYPDSYVDKSSIISIWRIVALLRRY